MQYEINISYYYSGIKQTISFRKNINTLNEIKESFLRHLGNIKEAPNKVLKEKALIKKLTYEANSLTELTNLINAKTSWVLYIRKI